MLIVLCIFACLGRGVLGYLGDDLAETSQLCCNHGTSYARNHSSEDCSSSIPPDVPKQFAALCIFAMDQCCKEYFQKKRDCDNGVEIATTTKSCDSTRDSIKNCCDECLRGTSTSSTGNVESCQFTTRGSSADELLAGAAFEQCCKKALNTKSGNSSSRAHERPAVTLSRKPSSSVSSIASLCEEYAPNELCAHHCIPVPGSYKCECNPGYKLMADGRNCMEVVQDRCKPRNPCQHKCIDNGIEVKCSCRRGYKLKIDGRTCEDIDECQLEPSVCLPNTECFNIQGSYKCIPNKVSHGKSQKIKEKGQCPSGFAWNINNNACDDIDECNLIHPPCQKYICQNTIGGYKCDGVSGDPASLPVNRQGTDERCPQGFRLNVIGECEDVDECALRKDDCNPLSQFCINTHGSYHCQNHVSKHCPPGFRIDPETNKCEDINECDDGEDICRPDQICVNVPGQYDCKPRTSRRNTKCPDGMRMKPGTDICEDIDECLEGTHLCDQHQNCLNTNGSHECLCKLGFELDVTTGACMDVNECASNQHNCIPGSQRCDNTVGSFLCIRLTSCGTGYILHHTTGTCEDIDECAHGTHNCHHAGPDYQCENHPGSFRCIRKKQSTTLPPDYYEYYESGEEMDVNQTDPKEPVPENKTPSTTTTTTTTSSTTPASAGWNDFDLEKPVPPVIADENDIGGEETVFSGLKPSREDDLPTKTNIQPETFKPIEPEVSKQPEIKPVTPRHPEEVRPIQPIQPEISRPSRPETPIQPENVEPIDPEISKQPQDVKPIITPSQPEQPKYDEPRQPEVRPIEPKPTDHHVILQPENHNFEKTEPSPTPPQVVLVDVGKETATIDGKKMDDGSVFVDTRDVPKNEWTKLNRKPSVSCPPGFEADANGVCLDIDECATHRHICSGLTEICRNTIGGYLCDCAPGFRRELSSGLCDHIVTTPSSTSTAPTTPAVERNTTLFWGYHEYRPIGTARPFKPRFMCDVGYFYNSHTRACDDINECTNGQANCADVEICVNTNGGYRCECPPNWKLDEVRHKCLPNRNHGQFPSGYANEPVYAPPLNPMDVIHGFNGPKYVEPEVKQVEDRGSVISCPSGYKLGYDNTCEDIDECSIGQDRCGNLMCTNLPGGYVCSCPPGHKLGSNNVCEDVDECSLGGNMPVCSQNADCVNTVGSYQCRCHKGFRSAPVNDKVCVDVDECTEHPAGSLCEHRCNNVWGGYRCSCHRGYRLNPDNNSTCNDVDECTEYKNGILCVGKCLNEPGSYRCTCPSGYRLSEDKKSCIDIDECETGEATCATGGQYAGTSDVCLNTRGSFRCHRIVCPQGYKLESKHRCTRIEKVCPPHDWDCAHQPTTYSYNFITFVSNLYIPESKVDLFTMRGPAWPNAKMRFQLRLVEVNAPPSVKNKADINAFLLVHTQNQAVMSLVRPLTGPQSIHLELSMELYHGDQFGGIAVARIYIYVSEYEF